MGNCGSSESTAAATINNEIDKQLKLEQKNSQQSIKLLLLGPGETGKSTILKQFKLIYGEGYTPAEKLAFRTTILTNVMTCTLSLLNAMDTLKIPFGFDPSTVSLSNFNSDNAADDRDNGDDAYLEDEKVHDDRGSAEEVNEHECEYEPDQEKKVERMALIESELPKKENPIGAYAAKIYKRVGGRYKQIGVGSDAAKVVRSHDMSFGISPGETLPQEVVDAVETACNIATVEQMNINWSIVVDSDRAREVCDPSYNPTEQDILNTRQMTTTVSETKIIVEKKVFRIFDVGGQRAERKKWAPYFDDVDAIIYLIAISSYDQRVL
ncbi:hypothetical protein HK100_011706 [Physocladia obscura]|uniref:Uncharacterized protein n=1 Tax=Physocladia obscura TaxID=109957 RepID=A0AAD5T0U1_9FUNG|nr:hypothetical protein HK100_011706 [Physocladia obscura]